ncbi:hypothetical protein AB1Y20_020617 [Prymnesium parvum]|uniref:Armadillo repeat-containing protein 8 n=1 Tax=Prymnesium parvum TaxID=97485 RepID=A0AB34JZW2_PRYPA
MQWTPPVRLRHAKSMVTPEEESEITQTVTVLSNAGSSAVDRFKAAQRLCHLARPRQGSAVLVSMMEDAIGPLVSMLRDSSSVSGQKIAATCLARLAVAEENQIQIAHHGGIDVVIMQVRQGETVVKERSAAVLSLLCDSPALRSRIAERGGINSLIQLLQKGSIPARTHAATALGNLARHEQCQESAEYHAIISERNGLTPLVELLRNGPDSAKEAVANALCALAKGSPANEKELLEKGVVPCLLDIILYHLISYESGIGSQASHSSLVIILISPVSQALEALGQNVDQLVFENGNGARKTTRQPKFTGHLSPRRLQNEADHSTASRQSSRTPNANKQLTFS